MFQTGDFFHGMVMLKMHVLLFIGWLYTVWFCFVPVQYTM